MLRREQRDVSIIVSLSPTEAIPSSSSSPDIRGQSESPEIAPVEAPLTLPAVTRKSRKRRREKSPSKERKKVVLSFVDSENLILSINKKRTLRRRK